MTTAAHSETCVSDTFDRPLPDATTVETRHADVPSPRFPGIWQEGQVDGFFYRIWSNEVAVLQSNRRSPLWTISVTCDGTDKACSQTVDGVPTPEALQTAGRLGKCLTDASFSGKIIETQSAQEALVPEEPVAPDVTTSALPAIDAPVAPPSDVTDPPPCGLASLPDGETGITLQRLLVAAGADPGPLDGLVGQRTYRALADVLGEDAAQLAQSDAIQALDQFLCAPSQ